MVKSTQSVMTMTPTAEAVEQTKQIAKHSDEQWQRYKLTISYDGTNYVGFQVQPNGPSIQAALEWTLAKMAKGRKIAVFGSGRTDSGVHALGQVIHFDYPAAIPPKNMQRALNSLLPEDIRVLDAKFVAPTFNAQYHAKRKRYRYKVSLADVMTPFERLYQWHHPYRTDIARMQEALDVIVGTHDFTSFCSTKTDKENKVRTVYRASVEYVSSKEIEFIFEGNGFLYNMIRILVGTAIQIGDGMKPIDELERLLFVEDRNEAGPTAPAHGLYLEKVWYDAIDETNESSN